MKQLISTSKGLIGLIIIASVAAAGYTRRDRLRDLIGLPRPAAEGPAPTAAAGSGNTTSAPLDQTGKRPMTVVINQWPGLMPLLVGAGGMTTQPGSAAEAEGLD